MRSRDSVFVLQVNVHVLHGFRKRVFTVQVNVRDYLCRQKGMQCRHATSSKDATRMEAIALRWRPSLLGWRMLEAITCHYY